MLKTKRIVTVLLMVAVLLIIGVQAKATSDNPKYLFHIPFARCESCQNTRRYDEVSYEIRNSNYPKMAWVHGQKTLKFEYRLQ